MGRGNAMLRSGALGLAGGASLIAPAPAAALSPARAAAAAPAQAPAAPRFAAPAAARPAPHAAVPAAALPPGARSVAIRGARIVWRASGRGAPLLLINGSGATLDVWDPAFLATLGRSRRLIAYDPRGIGGSTGRPGSIAGQADDAAALLRALRVRRADVLGWSMGGFVAQELALRHPRAVRRLVLASTDFGGPRAVRASPYWAALDRKTTLGAASIDEILATIFPPGARPAGDAYVRRLLAQPGGCCEAVGRLSAEAVLAAEDAWYRRGAGTATRLARLRAPTLVGAGASDVDVPAANARPLARRIRGARLVVYRDAGHAFLFQVPAFAALVARFLR